LRGVPVSVWGRLVGEYGGWVDPGCNRVGLFGGGGLIEYVVEQERELPEYDTEVVVWHITGGKSNDFGANISIGISGKISGVTLTDSLNISDTQTDGQGKVYVGWKLRIREGASVELVSGEQRPELQTTETNGGSSFTSGVVYHSVGNRAKLSVTDMGKGKCLVTGTVSLSGVNKATAAGDVITERSISWSGCVKNGSWTLAGSLHEAVDTKVWKGHSIFAKIPVVGRLFGSTQIVNSVDYWVVSIRTVKVE